MQTELDEIKEVLVKRIQILFEEKYDGNKSRFAKDVNCSEKAIRSLFTGKQGMTINLFFKIALALNVSPIELIKDLKLKNPTSK